jgi:hypothetical protein
MKGGKMNIDVLCAKCKKSLKVKDVRAPMNGAHEIIVEVSICGNVDCYDCSECEEEIKFGKLKDEFDNISDALETLATRTAETLKKCDETVLDEIDNK